MGISASGNGRSTPMGMGAVVIITRAVRDPAEPQEAAWMLTMGAAADPGEQPESPSCGAVDAYERSSAPAAIGLRQ